MGTLLRLGVALSIAGAAASPAWAAGPPDPKDLVKLELVPETASVAPATTLWVDLHLQIRSGWHVYWRNPGDSGLPTAIDWHLPPGFSAGGILWPVPEHFVQNDIGNYGYAGTADLLVPITVPKDVAAGDTATLVADASWLACAEICIPGGAQLSLSLPVASGPVAPDSAAAKLFAAIRDRLPLPAPFATRFTSAAGEYRLLVPTGAIKGMHDLTAAFFPYDGSLIDHAAEPRLSHRADGLELRLKKAMASPHGAPANLTGVLLLRGSDGPERAYEIAAETAPVPRADDGIGIVWWQALLLAFLGGVVLNAMPCVFPILSLKLLSLARQAHGHPSVKLCHGLAYTAGVLASFATLGGALLALRAGGQAIGWGFQLQTPVFVAAVAYLLFAMGLSLSGVVAFGAGLAGTGGRLADRAGLTGTFFTGVLATIVATPCTAPFMGAATGFALVAPGPVAIGIFLALGLGLAAPYLAATILPGWQRMLPRPGPWMDLVKQILAFPLYGTVAWLVWVLIQQVGPGQSLAALFGLVLVGFAAWIYGRTRFSALHGRWLGTGFAAAGFAGALMLAGSFATTGSATTAAAARDRLAYEPFTAARLAALEAAGNPVFVNLTADWCVTCLINERIALDSEGVRQAFAARGIVALKGDWTNRNPEITALLQQYGRSGVPLYLLYGGKGDPVILPQILTAATVLDALGRI
jgi:thiol:disulfide interchange protein DsbD